MLYTFPLGEPLLLATRDQALRNPGAWEAVTAREAVFFIRACLSQVDDGDLRRILTHVNVAFDLQPASRRSVEDAIVRELEWGRLRMFRELAVDALPPIGLAPELGEPEMPAEERHFVEIAFAYPDDTPVTGLPYVLVDPQGSRTPGKTSADGTVRKDPVQNGGYFCELKSIESVRWTQPRTTTFADNELEVRTSGYADGASLEVKLYLQYRETSADCLATLQCTVEAGMATVPFRYDETITDEIKTRDDIVRLIAEVIAEPTVWGKTLSPLEVELPTIVGVRFSSDAPSPGESVGIVIETRGFEDGTSANVFVHARRWLDDGEPHADLGMVSLSGGRAEAEWRFDPPEAIHESEAPPPCYVVVEIESPVARYGHSPLLVASVGGAS